MILHIQNAIEPTTLKVIIEAILEQHFIDGQQTAGRAAKVVKNNRQLKLQGDKPAPVKMLLDHLQKNPILQSATFAKQYINVMVNQYQTGMEYGMHVDDALVSNTMLQDADPKNAVAKARTDISFTLGLSDENSFDGGKLVIEDSTGERAWKLATGDLLIYPSHYLHRVNPVTQGQRLALVGWIESHVRDSQQREILFDLKCSMSEEFEQRGKTTQYDRLSKSYNNLLRLWAN